MTPDRLLSLFNRISDAPDAIPRLRRFILDLAVRGKLVEQDPNDEPSLSFNLTGRRQESVPFTLPATWQWVPLAALGKLKGGGTPSKSQPDFWGGDIPWVSPKDMKRDYIATSQLSISRTAVEKSSVNLIAPKSILFVVRGMILAHSFPVALSTTCLTINQDMKALELENPNCAEFVLRALKGMTPRVLEKVKRSSHGTGRLDSEDYSQIPIPLPPEPEQRRIVARVDELMALCDQLEAAQAEREAQRVKLSAASLARLNEPADDPAEFRQHVSFHLGNLPRLVTRPEHIPALRQTILNLAVRGKLVPQDPNDEPATELLFRIRERKRLLGEKPRSRTLKSAAPEAASGQFSMPSSWANVTTDDVCDAIIDCPHSTPTFLPQGVICLDTNSFKNGSLIPSKLRYVSEEQYTERVRRITPKAGDIVFAREGSVGESVIVPDGVKCCLGQRVMLFRPMPEVVSTYFQLAISTSAFLTKLLSLHKGIGARHVNVADMRHATLPLPPHSEQQRIVNKVEELLAVCDELTGALARARDESRRLLEAVLHEALAPALSEPELTFA